MIMKVCNRCGKALQINQKCNCQTAYRRNYNRFKRDEKIRKFRASREWQTARAAVLARDDGIDQYLLHTTGEVVAASSVHHIIPLADDWDKRLSMSNLISLSEETHGMIEKLYKGNKKTGIQELLSSIVTGDS